MVTAIASSDRNPEEWSNSKDKDLKETDVSTNRRNTTGLLAYHDRREVASLLHRDIVLCGHALISRNDAGGHEDRIHRVEGHHQNLSISLPGRPIDGRIGGGV